MKTTAATLDPITTTSGRVVNGVTVGSMMVILTDVVLLKVPSVTFTIRIHFSPGFPTIITAVVIAPVLLILKF